MKRYEAYKSSGVGWLGDIPREWECKKLGSLFVQRKTKVSDKDFEPLSVSKDGVVPQLESAVKTDAGDNRKLVKTGDFVINSRSDRKGSCGVSKRDGSVSLINIVLEPRNGLNGQYIHYLLRSHDFSEEYYRSGRGIVADLWTTRYSEMKNIMLPVPPRHEQDQIARYLDWQIVRINKLISEQKRKIKLLKEQGAVYISHIITQGIGDSESMVDSGVEWIGEVPQHWKIMRCKYLFSERDERSIDGSEQHLSMSQKHGLVPDKQLEEKRMLSESYQGGKVCYENDLVLNRLKAHLGVFSLAPQIGVISPDYTVLVPSTKYIIPAYSLMVLKSTNCRKELQVRVRGIIEGFWRLYTEDFNTIVLPIPPIEEQEKIIQDVKRYNEMLDMYVGKILQEIDTLNELRIKLISDVVTGQIDIRDVEVPEYECQENILDKEFSENENLRTEMESNEDE